jgi:O-antigen ligase
MAFWLLVESHSATSLVCMIIGLAVFLGLKVPALKASGSLLPLFALAGGLFFWVMNSVFRVTEFVVQDLLGRDMTLTTRTDVWPLLLANAEDPIFGAGFCSFWSGKRLEVLWGKFGIIQAHNGYLEAYLNGGCIAVFLLVGLVLSVGWGITQQIPDGDDYSIVRFMILVIATIHNFTEASFSVTGLLWFTVLLALTQYPANEFEGLTNPEVFPVEKEANTEEFLAEVEPVDSH